MSLSEGERDPEGGAGGEKKKKRRKGAPCRTWLSACAPLSVLSHAQRDTDPAGVPPNPIPPPPRAFCGTSKSNLDSGAHVRQGIDEPKVSQPRFSSSSLSLSLPLSAVSYVGVRWKSEASVGIKRQRAANHITRDKLRCKPTVTETLDQVWIDFKGSGVRDDDASLAITL